MPLPSAPRRTPARRAALLGLVPLGLAGGFAGGRALRPARTMPLPPALDADLDHLRIAFGQLALYKAGPREGTPLLLIHSINAAGNSYEVKPLFEHYAAHRPVYALDLPGYGFSDRNDRIYTPRLMTDAVLAAVEDIRHRHGPFPIDVIALSLSCEFLGRAASEHPLSFRSLGFVSPTGFETTLERQGKAGTTYGKPGVRDIVSFPLWGRGLFDLVASKASMRFFLGKTWGSPRIDEGAARVRLPHRAPARRRARGVLFPLRLPVQSRHSHDLQGPERAGVDVSRRAWRLRRLRPQERDRGPRQLDAPGVPDRCAAAF